MTPLSPRTWALLGTGLAILGLAAALLLTRATLSEAKAERDIAVARLGVSNASIETCALELDKATAQQVALANSDANRIAASRQAIELAQAAQEARQAAIDRLRASAATIAGTASTSAVAASCEASPTLLADWE